MFPESIFGLLVSGLPKAEPGQKVLIDGSGTAKIQPVCDPDGRKMIKACAVPELFDLNYPGSINATMNGKELVEMAEKVSEAEGILVCSATSFHSYPIYKNAYSRLKGGQHVNTERQWWQFWKPA